MIPRHIHPSWYRSYWFDPPGQPMQRAWRPAHAQTAGAHRVQPILLAIVLLSAVLAAGAVLINALAPVSPADLLFFLS
jgi:hypothetical protein